MAARTVPAPPGPAEVERRPSRMPMDTARAREWLRDLARSEPPEKLLSLQAALIELNSTPVDDGERLALLELVREPVEEIAGELDRRRVGLSLPLSRREAAMADAVSRLYVHLAQGYRAVLYTAGNDLESETGSTRERLARACHGAIVSLTGSLLAVFESYKPRPDNIWLELHGLLQFARTEGLLRKRLPGGDPVADDGDTVLLAYKRALLLGLCDPYHLPFRALQRMKERLPAWAQRTRLVTPSEHRRKGCLFLVDLERDNPAMPCLPHTRPIDDGRCLILDTTPLTVSLHDELREIEAGEQASPAGEDWPELLRTLLIRWGIHPVRHAPRHEKGGHCELVAGLRQLHMAVYEDSRNDDPLNSAAARFPAALHDEGPTGVQVRVDADEQLDAHIGGVLGVRTGGARPRWSVGVVRWARSRDYRQLALGVYKLGTDPLPAIAQHVTLTRYEGNSSEQHVCLLFPDADDPMRGRMVTGAGLHDPEGTLVVEAEGRRRMLRQGKRLLSTRAVDCFEYTVHSHTTMRPDEQRHFVR